MEIRLTPAGALQWVDSADESAAKRADPVRVRFLADWREGLFALAAERTDSGGSPTVRYWQGIAEQYLTRLCHLPESEGLGKIEAPSEAERAEWTLTAPPMQGGEYVSPVTLLGIWNALGEWGRQAIQGAGGLGPFLEARAPMWRQVGRVCFHLAENKTDPGRPFAFMATFVSGLGAAGRARHLPLGKALEQYAGANNRAALVKLLSPVQQAAERCDWVRALVDSGEVYRPMAWTPERAYRFLLSVPALEESGLMARLPDWWRRRARPQVRVTIGGAKPAMFGMKAMLDFDARVALGGELLTEDELKALLEGPEGLVLLKGQWVEVDREQLREAIAHWEALRKEAGAGGVSFIEGMRLLAGASADLRHEEQTEEERHWVHVEAGEAMRQVLANLRDPANLAEEGPDGAEGLAVAPRPYQRHGVAWLHFLTELGLGACLADDMGLGKTIQALGLLLRARRHAGQPRAPSLLVVPASLLGNWRAEAERFAPRLKLVFLHPAETDRATLERIEQAPARELASADLAVTTYSMATRQEWLAQVDWRLVILDEAQAIKNPSTRQTRAVKKLPARARLALTGTPVENRLGDLWSIFDFLNPGLLGSAAVFRSFIERLEKRERDQFAPLRRLVAPYILRRLKTDRSIIADLPDKTETTRFCSLTPAQVRLYETIVAAMKDTLKNADGMKRRALVLQTLMRLKQVCNHPSQLTGDGVFNPKDSGKFARLSEICEELAERQERALVFTQFREIIDPLAAHLSAVFGRAGLVLHGGTGVAQRKGLVERFQRDDGPPFFLLSLKAGGTGLNLTAASHVIHFDRWWNPAVEDQATDRAFRIGQRRNVLVHKFVTRGTVEERIDKMIAEKRQLAAEALSGANEIDVTELNDEALLNLVRLDVGRAAMEGG